MNSKISRIKTLINRLTKNTVTSNLIVAAVTGLFSILFVRSCEEKKLSNTHFDFDPANLGTNFVSINQGVKENASGRFNEINADFSKSDTIFVSVFVDYRNDGTEIIEKPVVRIDTNLEYGTSERFIFYAELEADNVSKMIDNTIVKNLPEYWEIQFMGGYNTNTHYLTDPKKCNEKFNYNLRLGRKEIKDLYSNGYQLREKLELDGNGWCSQGTVGLSFRIIKLE